MCWTILCNKSLWWKLSLATVGPDIRDERGKKHKCLSLVIDATISWAEVPGWGAVVYCTYEGLAVKLARQTNARHTTAERQKTKESRMSRRSWRSWRSRSYGSSSKANWHEESGFGYLCMSMLSYPQLPKLPAVSAIFTLFMLIFVLPLFHVTYDHLSLSLAICLIVVELVSGLLYR